MTAVEALADEFYESDANMKAANTEDMWLMAIDDIKKKYPNVPEDIAQAFAWRYTFDNR